MDQALESEQDRDKESVNYAVVRPASMEDLEAIVNLAIGLESDLAVNNSRRSVSSEEELRKLYEERLKNLNKDFNYGIFVAEKDGMIVGYAFGRAPTNMRAPFYALFQGIYVLPEARGKGVSDLLTEEMVIFARESGASSLKADVYSGSVGEAYFGRKLGWSRESNSSGLVRLVSN